MNTMNNLQRNYLSTPDAEYEKQNSESYHRRQNAIDWIVIVAWFAFLSACVGVALWIHWSLFGPDL